MSDRATDGVQMSLRATTCMAVALLLLVACRGPSPVVTSHEVLPGAADAPLRIEATVANRGGAGQVAVEALVRERASQAAVARAQREVDVERGGTQRVLLELHERGLRDGLTRGELELTVVARYPIE